MDEGEKGRRGEGEKGRRGERGEFSLYGSITVYTKLLTPSYDRLHKAAYILCVVGTTRAIAKSVGRLVQKRKTCGFRIGMPSGSNG